MLVQAILIGLIAMFVTFEWMFGTNSGSRPIITGMLVGLVMGDLKTGIILGATLEMVFIGSITLGAAVPPDVITGGVLVHICNFNGKRCRCSVGTGVPNRNIIFGC